MGTSRPSPCDLLLGQDPATAYAMQTLGHRMGPRPDRRAVLGCTCCRRSLIGVDYDVVIDHPVRFFSEAEGIR